ncbi:MAG: mechanosensitive ion channel family protein [Xanthomonadales bacterium]
MKHPKRFLLLACLLLSVALPAAEPPPDAAAAPLDVPAETTLDPAQTVRELELLAAPMTLEQLEKEAARWQELVQQSMARIANLKVAALSAEGEEAERLLTAINENASERNTLIGQARVILDSMELKGADPELLKGYRQYVSGALAAEIKATDFRTTVREIVDWAASRDGGIGFMLKSAGIVVALVILWLVARLVRALAARGIRRMTRLSHLLQEFLLKTVFWLSFLVGLLIVLSMLGVNITPLFAVVGGASFILAFAMQETLGNLASGLMIMINKPFDVGDLINTNSVLGKVESVSIVSTTVRTIDNQVVILPNSSVWGSIITNVTVSPTRRVDLVFGIGYGDDIDKASSVLERVVRAHPMVLEDPEPVIKVHELADSSVNFVVRPWAETENYWQVYWDLTRQVKQAFDAEGITIPFPQRDVHFYRETPES